MGRSTTSLRLDDALRERLATLAELEGTSVTALVERFVREGLAVAEHPGIVFKPGPSGRRAALAGGPDVWEIASAFAANLRFRSQARRCPRTRARDSRAAGGDRAELCRGQSRRDRGANSRQRSCSRRRRAFGEWA